MTTDTLDRPAQPETLTPSWRKAFVDGFAPSLSTAGLQALRTALVTDDGRLLQGATLSPPPLDCVKDWHVEAADPIAFTFWIGDGLRTIEEVEAKWAAACHLCDKLCNLNGACRYLMSWIDETPRDEMRRELLAAVDDVLAERGSGVAAVA